MAIKISGDTIINDSRVVENADRIGIGTTNPYVALEISSGDVGIGTTNPTGSDIKTSLESNTNVLAVGIVTANEYFGTFKGTIDADVAIDKANKINITDDTTGSGTHYIHFGSATSGYDGVEVDSTDLVYKDRKFGIGTNDPSGTLEVQKNGVPAIISNYNNSKHVQIDVGNDGGGFQVSTGNHFAINHQPYADRGTNNNLTERLQITSDGIVKITNSEPQVQLIDSDGTNQFTQIIQSSNAFYIDLRDNTNDGQLVIRGKGGDTATERLRITPTGDVYIRTGDVGIGTDNPNHELTIWGDEPTIRLTHCKPDGSNNSLNAFYAIVNSEGVTFNSYQDVSAIKRPFIFKQYDVERLRITTDGHLSPGATDAYDLGTSASNRFRTVYAQTFNGEFQGTADVAATVSVADESTDTTCFPLFVTAATGNLAAKSGSNLTFNSATGALGATSFVGGLPITNGADNRVITASSASAIQGESNLTFDGSLLSLAGDMQFTAANPELEFNNGGPRFRVPAANTLAIHNGGGLGSTNNEVLRIDSNGNIGVNAIPSTSGGAGTLYGTVDHFLVIGDSDTGIAQDGDGEFEIWANDQEIVNFSTAGVDPKKSILPSGSIDIGSATTKISHGYFTNITADSITAELTGSASLLDVADDTTDTDGYLLFSNDTGADQTIKTNADIRYNASIGSLNLSKTNGGIKFGPGTAASDDAHIEWLGGNNAGYLRIAVSDDQDAAATAEHIEFGDYDLTGGVNAASQAFTQHVKISRSEFLVRTGSNTIPVVNRLKIDENGNIGLNVSPSTSGGAGTLYGTVDHFLVIGDSDTGIAQDGDGEFEIWANDQEIVNFNTTQITPTKSIIPNGTGTLNLGSTDKRWGTIYANTLDGSISGTISNATDAVNAENVKVTQRDTSGQHYLTFVASDPSGTNLALYGDNDLQFNPSTNRLSAAQMKPGGIVDSSDGTGTANYVIKADGSGGWSWGQVTGDSGVSLSFLGLSDTPDSFTADKVVKVNSSGDALIFADAGSLSNLAVKQYSDNEPTRTERSCKEPIGVVVDSGTVTIGIGTTSNAYGAKYVQDDDPTTSDGGSYSACDGDIWFDTSGAEPGSGTDNTIGAIVEASKFFQNPTSLTESTTFPASGTKNGGAFGPYEIANGVTFTINSGSTFTII